MMLLLQVAFMLMIGSGLSLSSSSSMPKYLQAILSDYKFPIGVFEKELETQKIESLDIDLSILSHLDSILQLRKDLYHTYSLANQIKDPISRMLYRNKYSDGAKSLKGSMNFENGSKRTVINYSLQIEEHPISSPALTLEQMLKPNLRSSAELNQMIEESSSQAEWPRIISLSRAPQKLKSTSMDDLGYLFQKTRLLSPLSGMKDDSDSAFGDLETLSSQWIEDVEQSPDYQSGDMEGSPTVFTIKPRPRGYEQVFRRGEGLVVDREYDLPYDYRSALTHRADFDDDEDEQPLYVHHTKPSVKVIEVSRDEEGNYEVPEGYNTNKKQQGFDDMSLYTTHVKPAVHVMPLSSEASGEQNLNGYEEFDSQGVAYMYK